VRGQEDRLVNHPGYEYLEQLLVESIAEAARAPAHFIADRELLNAQFIWSQTSIDALVRLAVKRPDPLLSITGLPRDWQAVRAARLVIEAGCREQKILDFAADACKEHLRGGSANAWHETGLCLSLLARLSPDAAALKQLRDSNTGNFLQSRGPVDAFVKTVDSRPGAILEILDGDIRNLDGDIQVLFEWESLARSWQGVLISRLYGRMFDPKPITTKEACELCDQMLAVVNSLDDGPLKEEYRSLYETLRRYCAGGRNVELPRIQPERVGLIAESHRNTVSLLQDASGSDVVDDAWLENAFDRVRWDTSSHSVKCGSMSSGFGLRLTYVLPPVRLALAAIGQRSGNGDVVARCIAQQADQ
jgi:hypothetical protein